MIKIKECSLKIYVFKVNSCNFLFIFQAMNKLLVGCEDVSGQIFYLNDGTPTNLFFFLNPLYSLVNPAAKTCPPAIHLPPKLTTLTALIFNTLSKIFGETFHLPFWGFTYMESYKVCVHVLQHDLSVEILRKKPSLSSLSIIFGRFSCQIIFKSSCKKVNIYNQLNI